MKRITSVIAITLAGLALQLGAALAGNTLYMLSPYSPKEDVRAAMRHAFETMQPGGKAVFVDGLGARSICNAQVPDKPAYAHPKAKLKLNGACVRAVMQFAQEDVLPEDRGLLHVPQALRFIGGNYDLSTFDAIVMIGSPIYHDPHEPRLTMRAARVPNDAHIRASRQASLFGTQGLSDLLKGMPVHWASSDMDWKGNEKHAYLVQRFWTLYVTGLGGELNTFSGDVKQMLARAQSGALAPANDFVLNDSAKLEMNQIRLERFAGPPIHERELSTTPPRADLVAHAQNVEVGILWTNCARCDLDVHVRPYPGAEFLYYGHPHSREGVLYKDFTDAPQQSNGLETVAFAVPVDLTKMLIAVNFHGGSVAEDVQGEVRIAIGMNTYAAPFTIKANSGNGGQGRKELFNSGQAPNAGWVIIDPLKVLRLK